MPRYKVRPGAVLPHAGLLLEAGTVLELPRHVGEDSIVRSLVEAVDETADESSSGPDRQSTKAPRNRMVDARTLVNRTASSDASTDQE